MLLSQLFRQIRCKVGQIGDAFGIDRAGAMYRKEAKNLQIRSKAIESDRRGN